MLNESSALYRGLEPSPIPWADFRREVEPIYQPPSVSRATAAKVRQVLNELDALALTSTADLTPALVARYIASRPANQSAFTLHGMLGWVRTFCQYAETAGFIRVSPFRLRKLSKWVRLPSLQTTPRHFSREQIRAVMTILASDVEQKRGWAQWKCRRDLIAVAIVSHVGCRKSEALRLQVQDVDVANRILYIRPHGVNLKTAASEAPIPIPEALVPYIQEWEAHRLDSPVGHPVPLDCPWFVPTTDRKAAWVSGSLKGRALSRLKAAAARAGVEGMTYLSLRHSWATHAEYFGLGPSAIQRVLRHTSPEMARKHYRHADLPNLRQMTSGIHF